MGIMGMFGGGGGGGFRGGGGMRPQTMGAIGGMMPGGIPNPYFQPPMPMIPPSPVRPPMPVPAPQAAPMPGPQPMTPPLPNPNRGAIPQPQGGGQAPQPLPPSTPLSPVPPAPLGAAKPPMLGATPPGSPQPSIPPSPLGPSGPQQIPMRPAPQGGMPPGFGLNPAQPPTGATSPHLAFNPGAAPNSFNPANAPSAFGKPASPLGAPPPLPDRNPMRTAAPQMSMLPPPGGIGPQIPQYGPPPPAPPMTRPLPNPNRIVGSPPLANPNRIVGEMPARKPAAPHQLPAMKAITAQEGAIPLTGAAAGRGWDVSYGKLTPEYQTAIIGFYGDVKAAMDAGKIAKGNPMIASGYRSPTEGSINAQYQAWLKGPRNRPMADPRRSNHGRGTASDWHGLPRDAKSVAELQKIAAKWGLYARVPREGFGSSHVHLSFTGR